MNSGADHDADRAHFRFPEDTPRRFVGEVRACQSQSARAAVASDRTSTWPTFLQPFLRSRSSVGCSWTTTMSHTSSSLASLLAHEDWARSLARALVRDTTLADDLVQHAFQAALVTPPDAAIPPRRWLASVLRNQARFHARSTRNRAATEQGYARQEASEKPAVHALRVLEGRSLLQRALMSLTARSNTPIT